MNKLLIRKIRMYNPYWYAVRFTGDTIPFKAMVFALKRHGAYWRKGEFDGYGAWIVRVDILDRYADRFDNYDNRIGIAKRTYERLERQGRA